MAGSVVVVDLLRAAIPILPVPIAPTLQVDWRVAGFSIAVAALAGVIAALLPAVHVSRMSLGAAARIDGGGSRRLRARQALVFVQVATSILLVVTALLLGRSLSNTARVDPGFAADGVEVASLDLRLAGYDGSAGSTFVEELRSRLSASPDIASVALARVVPLSGTSFGLGSLRRADQPARGREIDAMWNLVSPGYFDTLRIPIVRGRDFRAGDTAGAGGVAIVNETFARRTWPGTAAVGQTLVTTTPEGERALEVVGVARDAKYASLMERPGAFIYVPEGQFFEPRLSVLLRPRGESAMPAVRRIVREMNPSLPVLQASTLRQAAASGVALQRGAAWVAGLVGVVGLLLAALGVYGITAYSATQRRREIGIRVAVGALRGQVMRMIVHQSMRVTIIAAIVGLLLAAGGARLLSALLYGIGPFDPVSFGGAAALLTGITLVATVIPAYRAASVNPVQALRTD